MAEVTQAVGLRRFSVDEYHRMAEAGVFMPGESVELIRGVIREMTPKGRRHAIAVTKAINIFAVKLAGRASTYVQDPLIMRNGHSEPEPDLVITSNPDPDAYGTENSLPLLVIEIADTSLKHDRSIKGPLYAEADVPEYWIVNLVDNVLEVYREPSGDTYQHMTTHEPGNRIAPLAWPDMEIEVQELFPSEKS